MKYAKTENADNFWYEWLCKCSDSYSDLGNALTTRIMVICGTKIKRNSTVLSDRELTHDSNFKVNVRRTEQLMKRENTNKIIFHALDINSLTSAESGNVKMNPSYELAKQI